VRVVIDTVVLVRGLLGPFSRSGKLLFELSDVYEWIVSPEIVVEYLKVTNRTKLVRKYVEAENRDLAAILVRIAAATLVRPGHVPSVCRDPSDDKFLAAAEAGNADFIVSADNDLLSQGEYNGAHICTVEELLQELGCDKR
jgi:putative PIN family toxin of toxin-antitoxin system